MMFTDSLEAAFSSADVIDSSGTRVDDGTSEGDPYRRLGDFLNHRSSHAVLGQQLGRRSPAGLFFEIDAKFVERPSFASFVSGDEYFNGG